MIAIKEKAYAKINLSLDVVNKREDGYHDIETIMQQVDIADNILMREIEEDEIKMESNSDQIPKNSRNTAYSAAQKIKNKYNIVKGVEIYIDKKIPVMAGLAGGSSDAAAVIRGLNKLWNLKMSNAQMKEIGFEIGSDVPYCIEGGTCLAESRGEVLKKLPPFKLNHILLANPGIAISTKTAYEDINLKNIVKRPDIKKLIGCIEEKNANHLSANMVNVFETIIFKKHPEIESIKKTMLECGALGALMSGSGSTVFGIFEAEDKLNTCEDKLNKTIKYIKKTKTI